MILFNMIIMNIVLVLQSAWYPSAFTINPVNSHYRPRIPTTTTSSLNMALTPVGPFCPFRSSAALAIEPQMETMNTSPDFATEMSRIQLDMQVGETPDADRLLRVSKGISEAVDNWEGLITALRTSDDFQTREYAKLTEAHLEQHGQTTEEIAGMMRWQSGCMGALAENRPPPMPPPGIDIMKMMAEARANEEAGKPAPSISAMSAAEKITSTPFTGDELAFQSDTVREEYEAICRDHSSLIDMGGSYASFDAMGKIAFLDQIDAIEERWDIFFARFSLLGQLNQDFVKQCNAFLNGMGLDEQQFRNLLQATHKLMRDDAEKERNALV